MNLLTSSSDMNNLLYSDSSQNFIVLKSLLHIKIIQGALGGKNAIARHGLIKSVYLRDEAQKIRILKSALGDSNTHADLRTMAFELWSQNSSFSSPRSFLVMQSLSAAAAAIHSDFRAQEEICHCFHLLPFYLLDHRVALVLVFQETPYCSPQWL